MEILLILWSVLLTLGTGTLFIAFNYWQKRIEYFNRDRENWLSREQRSHRERT
jgi:hypothetical protein